MLNPRRDFLKSSMALGFLGLSRNTRGAPTSKRVISPYGDLVKDPAQLLDLPKGFRYQAISKIGDEMDDGLKVPGKFDDMAAFAGENGRVILIRNHELAIDQPTLGPFADGNLPASFKRDLCYDPGGEGENPQFGGTTTLVYDPKTGKTEKEFLSLSGSDRNCSGGTTPWGSWITCEESEDLTTARGIKHGYCFEVKADPKLGLQKPVALKALGRFRHEAVSVDLVDGSVYLTEDREDSLLYRFVPKTKGDLSEGTLYALALKNKPSADLRNHDPDNQAVGEGKPLPIRWIKMKDIDGPKDDLRIRGAKAGAALFARGEGIYEAGGAHYFCCTNGGPNMQGQVFRILPRHFGDADPAIELYIQPEESDLVTNADNLCAAPNGDLIICEDLIDPFSKTMSPHLRGITPEGKIYTLGRYPHQKDEFCGSCFSPDGKILFVNIQNVDTTFAITGPWRK